MIVLLNYYLVSFNYCSVCYKQKVIKKSEKHLLMKTQHENDIYPGITFQG